MLFILTGILRGLPIIDTINMATEVLKNQLIEFPQSQDQSNVENPEPNPSPPNSQTRQLDHRSSIDLSQEDAIRIAAESARALESLKIMNEICTGRAFSY